MNFYYNIQFVVKMHMSKKPQLKCCVKIASICLFYHDITFDILYQNTNTHNDQYHFSQN